MSPLFIPATTTTAANRFRTLITTVRTLDGGDYYFQRDNGETLYPGNKSRVPGYKPDPDKTQRVIIWFTLQNGIADYDYNIDLYFVENIYTGTSEIVTDAARLEEHQQNGRAIRSTSRKSG